MVTYYKDIGDGTNFEWVTVYTPYYRHFLFYGSNECVMFIPGTYEEMMENYG